MDLIQSSHYYVKNFFKVISFQVRRIYYRFNKNVLNNMYDNM